MADFQVAYKRLLKFEGGWSNNPADAGGETYRGISRRWWPDWGGWNIIDVAKKHSSFYEGAFDVHLGGIPRLNNLVQEWYHEEWWNAFGLDDYEQDLADELFEQAVNLGSRQGCKHVQRCCNALNWHSGRPIFEDLLVDGKFGPKTRQALHAVSSRHSVQLINQILNVLQFGHYISLACKKKNQRSFLHGWLSRTFVFGTKK